MITEEEITRLTCYVDASTHHPMVTPGKRDNAYLAERLEKDGHRKLLARVDAGEISMYKAALLTGYRKKGPKTPAATLSYHWKRASAAERRCFVAAHPFEIDRALKDFLQERKALKEAETFKDTGK